jgi:flagellar protein FlbD
MILLTRSCGTQVILNADHIELIERIPETVVRLTNGTLMRVREEPGEIVRRVLEYKHRILAGPPPESSVGALADAMQYACLTDDPR